MSSDFENLMGSKTSSAYDNIKADLLKCENGELAIDEVLDFLIDSENFKSLPELLKETIIKAQIPQNTPSLIENKSSLGDFYKSLQDANPAYVSLNDNDNETTFINALYCLISKLQSDAKEYDNENNHKTEAWKSLKHFYSLKKVTVRNWFDLNATKTSFFKQREHAIEVCFALNLDYESSRLFLTKCGETVFNVRNANDAIYAYCIKKGWPLSSAINLILSYESNSSINTDSISTSTLHTGETTSTIKKQLFEEAIWTSKDDFYNNFLIKNKPLFISFSRTTSLEYFKLKIPLYLSTLREILNNEYDSFENYRNQRKFKISGKSNPLSDIQITLNFINNLEKYKNNKNSAILEKAARNLHKRLKFNASVINNTVEIVNSIESSLTQDIYSMEHFDELNTISDFLSVTLTTYRFLDKVLPFTVADDDNPNNQSRQRKFSDSSLSETILLSFPHRPFFTSFEKKPAKHIHNKSLRKAIIALYYLKYVHDYISSSTHDEQGIETFISSLNEILLKCQLGTIYPANQFDWLILQSIKDLDNHNIKSTTDDDYFFSDNLANSFFNTFMDDTFES